MRRATRQENSAALAKALAEAQDPQTAAKILRNAGLANISDGALRAAGAPRAFPGYRFDRDEKRYTRVPVAVGAGSAAVGSALAEAAGKAYAFLENACVAEVDGARGSLRLAGKRTPPIDRLASLLHSRRGPADRAEVVRGALPLRIAPLAIANPKANWGALPNGNMGGARGAAVLARPHETHTGVDVHDLPAPTWGRHQASDRLGVPLVSRVEPLLHVDHRGVPVERVDAKLGVIERGSAMQRLLVAEEVVFAVDPKEARGLMDDPALLEEIYQERGDGFEDVIVPAIGLVVASQKIQYFPQL